MKSLSVRRRREDSVFVQYGNYRFIRTFFNSSLREGLSGEKDSDRLRAEISVSGGEGDLARSNED